MRDSEFEDLLSTEMYAELLDTDYGVALPSNTQRKSVKWSEQMKSVFNAAGKPWSDSTKAQLKWKIAEKVAMRPESAIDANREGPIKALIKSLQSRVESASK